LKEVFRVRPDFVFRTQRLAVFVDGCFWHGCPRHATWPRQNAKFWREKILRNRTRDRLVTRTLRAHGWTVLRLWEHELPSSLGASARPGARAKERCLLARLRRASFLGDAEALQKRAKL
jgi:DNA mismatch endonuclease (patch repair protein)